ncbi:hypothetical protein EJP82_23540 [Paenibacillus anaericanus]|uniref:HTH luxR-type domain-containing protein n=1 Tax=Paenibacillus anaericanus TaxID=170367 RepID=A0A433Y189_9BACL|nr:LuxR C-terminal-related transcriptional regulator [Paenibacillus anaericanus]RUT41439.1 hypothetical protein EJP82_23540 [Paenibacillus anaericanus]
MDNNRQLNMDKVIHMRPLILTSKISFPSVNSHYVPRPRLMEQLNESVRFRLTLVTAPAGSGKTTLVSSWVTQCNLKACWVSLESVDNDFNRFWTYIAAAVDKCSPGFARRADYFYQSSRGASVEAMVSFMLHELNQLSYELVLVLDDYHVIDNLDIHDSICFLLEHLPLHIHLILMSRNLPPASFPLSRLRVRSQLMQLDSLDLRFTRNEIQLLEHKSLGHALSLEDLVLLEEKTEGWAAGLILAFLSMSGRSDHASFIQSFAGNHRYVLDYLMDEVLLRQSEQLQSLLLQTSILDRFSALLAEAVTGNPHSSELVHTLESSQMFLIPLDDTRVWFRYHHLFADMLRERLQHKCNAEEIAELHRRAYHWYESQGMFMEAIQHALTSGDHEIAAHMMERNFSAIITQGEESRLKLWLGQTPLLNIIHRPDLFYFQAGTMARSGHIADARRFLERVEQILTIEASTFTPEVMKEVQMRMGLYGASLDFYQGDVASFIQALDVNREGLLRFPSIVHVVNLGEALLYRGPIGFGGRLKKMANLISLVSTSEERRAIIHATLQGHGFVFLADLNYEWNRLDEAIIALDQGVSANAIEPNLGVMTPGYILQSKIYQAEGHLLEAEQTITGAISDMEAVHSPYWQLLLEARLVRIKLTRGDVDAGLQWIQLRHLQVMDKSSVQREYEHVTLARVLMANHQQEEAIRWLTVLLIEAKRADRLGSQIEILLLMGLCHHALRQHSLAVDRMDQALKLAEPEGYVRIFLDEGKPLLRLLSWWLKEKRLDEEELSLYVERLLQAFSLTTSSVRQKRAAGRKDDNIALVSLTEREKQIMLLITEGRSNSEIAEQLFIAPGTVKRYIHNLYQKLEVSSRVQAVARMKELLTE